MCYKVGDIVVISRSIHGHGYDIGQRVVIVVVNQYDYVSVSADESDRQWWITDEEIEGLASECLSKLPTTRVDKLAIHA